MWRSQKHVNCHILNSSSIYNELIYPPWSISKRDMREYEALFTKIQSVSWKSGFNEGEITRYGSLLNTGVRDYPGDAESRRRPGPIVPSLTSRPCFRLSQREGLDESNPELDKHGIAINHWPYRTVVLLLGTLTGNL
jgi:hypothetical protein